MLAKKETNQKFDQLKQLILERQKNGVVPIATNDFLDFLKAKNNLYYIQKLEKEGFIRKIRPAVKNIARGWSPAEYEVRVNSPIVHTKPIQIHVKENPKTIEVDDILSKLTEISSLREISEIIKNKDMEIEDLKLKLESEIQKQNERKSKISDIIFSMLNL